MTPTKENQADKNLDTTINSGRLQLVAVVAFVAIAVIGSRMLQTEYQPPVQSGGGERTLYVETETFEPGPYQIVFETTGTVESVAQIDIVPQVTGQVVSVSPQFFSGGGFAAGEALFVIDPRDAQNEVDRLEAEVARAATALQLEEVEAAAAMEEWRLMHGSKPVPALVSREPQQAQAKANLMAAEASLAGAELALQRTAYRLPFAGRVMESRIAQGQFVQAGVSYGSVFDIAALEVVASLKGQELAWLTEAPSAVIRISADHLGREIEMQGVFKRGAASLDATTRFATVRFAFENPPVELIPGVFVRIEVSGPRKNNALEIPASALQQNGNLWVVSDDGTLEAFSPEIIYADERRVAIANVMAPMRIVTSRVPGATRGLRVRLDDSSAPVPVP